MTNQHLLGVLPKCTRRSILVVGDLMLDEYLWCRVNRISPEAPVPVCRVVDTTHVPGGAANVANNIHSLGNTVLLVGVIGLDGSGARLKKHLREHHISCDYLIEDIHRSTILKSRIIAHHQHVVRVDREDGEPISVSTRNKVLKQVALLLPQIDAVLLSDYQKGTLSDAVIQQTIKLCRDHHKPIVIDPKGNHYRKYTGATILTPNMSEFQACIKKEIHSESDIHSESLKLIKQLKLQALLITRSEEGMSVILETGEKHDIPTKAKEVFDITGAGDTVIAVLTTALAAGLSIQDAATLANHAAGIVVGKVGTSTVSLEELQKAIEND